MLCVYVCFQSTFCCSTSDDYPELELDSVHRDKLGVGWARAKANVVQEVQDLIKNGESCGNFQPVEIQLDPVKDFVAISRKRLKKNKIVFLYGGVLTTHACMTEADKRTDSLVTLIDLPEEEAEGENDNSVIIYPERRSNAARFLRCGAWMSVVWRAGCK